MLKKIIVPVDGSEDSYKALEYAVSLGRNFNSEILVVHVAAPYDDGKLPSPIKEASSAEAGAAAAVKKQAEEKTETPLDIAKKKVELLAYHNLRYLPLIGMNPAMTIIEQTEHQVADLVIMGSRGLGGFAGLLVGSVSSKVVQGAQCPVLIVK